MRVLGPDNADIPLSVWENVVAEVDSNGNGEIEFIEFCEMMRKLIRN